MAYKKPFKNVRPQNMVTYSNMMKIYWRDSGPQVDNIQIFVKYSDICHDSEGWMNPLWKAFGQQSPHGNSGAFPLSNTLALGWSSSFGLFLCILNEANRKRGRDTYGYSSTTWQVWKKIPKRDDGAVFKWQQPHHQPRSAQPGDWDPGQNERNTKLRNPRWVASMLVAVPRGPPFPWPLLPGRKEAWHFWIPSVPPSVTLPQWSPAQDAAGNKCAWPGHFPLSLCQTGLFSKYRSPLNNMLYVLCTVFLP